MNDRQLHAIQNPCRIEQQCEGRAQKFAAGDQWIVTALTVRMFPDATMPVFYLAELCWRWQASVAIIKGDDYKAVSEWDYNDRSAAVDLAADLLKGVGAGREGAGQGRFEGIGVHLVRQLTDEERVIVKQYCPWLSPLPVPKKKSIGKMWMSNVNLRANGVLN